MGLLQNLRNPTDPDVRVLLGNLRSKQFRGVCVTAGLLPIFQPGCVYDNGVLVSQRTSSQEEVELSFNTETAQAVLLQHLFNDALLKQSFQIVKVLSLRGFDQSAWHVIPLEDGRTTALLPAFVGLQFYWCRTSQLAQLFLTCELTRQHLSVCEEAGAGFAQDGAYEIELKPPFRSNDLPIIARMSCDPKALAAALQICASLNLPSQTHAPRMPNFFWPSRGDTVLRIHGTRGHSSVYGEVILIDRILSCTLPFPFGSVRPLHGYYDYDADVNNPSSAIVGSRNYQGSPRVRINDNLRTNRRKRRRRVELSDAAFLAFREEEPLKIYRGLVRPVKTEPIAVEQEYGTAPGRGGKNGARGINLETPQGSEAEALESRALLPLDVFSLALEALERLQQAFATSHDLAFDLINAFPIKDLQGISGFPEDSGAGAYRSVRGTLNQPKKVLIAKITFTQSKARNQAYLVDVERQARAYSALLLCPSEEFEPPYTELELQLKHFASHGSWNLTVKDSNISRLFHTHDSIRYARYIAGKLGLPKTKMILDHA
jgi:hypothetical protein